MFRACVKGLFSQEVIKKGAKGRLFLYLYAILPL